MQEALDRAVGSLHVKEKETSRNEAEGKRYLNLLDQVSKHIKTLVKYLHDQVATTSDPNVIESTNRQIRTIENLKSDVKRMIKASARKKGTETDFFALSAESGTESRLSIGSQARSKDAESQNKVLQECPVNFKRPNDIAIQMTGTKRKRLEINDVDSQKAIEKENSAATLIAEAEDQEIPHVSSSSKKRVAKQAEKANSKSNQKRGESDLDVTVATAVTLVSANAKAVQKLAVKEIQERPDELLDRT